MKLVLDDVIRLVQTRGGITTWWDSLLPYLVEDLGGEVTKPKRWLKYAPAFVKCDFFFSSYYRINLFPGCKNVLVIHDVLREQHIPGLKTKLWVCYIRFCLLFTKKLVFISESTKRAFYGYYGKPSCETIVIHHGFQFPDIPDFSNRKSFDFIFVGKRGFYKNFVGGLRYISDSHLAIVGGDLSQDELQSLRDAGVSWEYFGFVDEVELKYLFKQSRFLFWPSLDEGFGMPLIEAISNGCIPVCLDVEINREVLGDYRLTLHSWRETWSDYEAVKLFDHVRSRFNHAAMVEKYVNLFR